MADDDLSEVAKAVHRFGGLLDPLLMVGDRRELIELRNGLAAIIQRRTMVPAAPPPPMHGALAMDPAAIQRAIHATTPAPSPDQMMAAAAERNVACAIVDELADSQPVLRMPAAGHDVNGKWEKRCKHCQALAPDQPALWTDPAWHEAECLWARSVVNKTRRERT